MHPIRHCLIAVFYLFALTPSAADAAIEPGQPVPDLSVTTLDGTATTLHALRGDRPLVLVVWCSSCHSCRTIEAQLDAVAKAVGDRAAVYALASNSRETADTVRKRQQGAQLTFPVVVDRNAAVADRFGVTTTTTALVIAQNGRLAYKGQFVAGNTTYAVDALKALLAGTTPTVLHTEQRGCPIR